VTLLLLTTALCKTMRLPGGGRTLVCENWLLRSVLDLRAQSTEVNLCAIHPHVHQLMSSGYDGSLMNGLLSNPRFVTAIDNPDGNKLGIISAAYSLGALIGVVPAPWVADKYGRKASIACGAIIIIAGSMVQTFTTGGNAMLGGRLVVGLGASFQNIGGGPLVAEVAHPRNRAQATALINTCWYIGSIIAAWTTFGALNIASSWSWRICCLIQAVPCALQLVGLWFCEESPRWLISKGQEQKALGVLAKYHGNGDENDELVSFEFQEIKEAIAAERAATANVNVWSLTKTKGNRHRLLILIVSQLQIIQTPLTSLSVWPSSPSGSEMVSSRTTSPRFLRPSASPILLHKLDSTAVFRSSIGWLL
jgi:MFS family permease